ncbi:MAG: MBL fold metallo-hydrolase [Acidimicrobiales bacterium]
MEAPYRQVETERVTADTHLIRQIWGEGFSPVAVYINSMVITGAEPVVVDCGPKISGKAWMNEVFAVVEPEDVRWIFLSHEDHDHSGNLVEMLELCPNAKLVGTWFMAERFSAEHVLPFDRMRLVNDGERFSVGDRELVAVTPPVFDNPTTRGLFDPSTGVYWAVDSFGTPVTHDVRDINELDEGFWREGFLQFARMVSPWHQWLDANRYAAHVDSIRRLGATKITSAHGPTLHGAQLEAAFELSVQIPNMPAAPAPVQADLDGMLAAMAAAAPAAA